MNSNAILIGVAMLSLAACLPRAQAGEGAKLVVVSCAEAPAVDGKGDDAVWRLASPVGNVAKGAVPKSAGRSCSVMLRAVRTETHIYLLAQWADVTKSESGHKTWVWDATKGSYVEDSDREDALSIAFEHTGAFTGDMLATGEAVWDVWHWKAFRTNPQGFAMDRTHRYTKSQPAGKAAKHTAKDGSEIWIARPEDSGDTVEKKQAAPAENQGARVPQYVAGAPSGSAADVRAKGAWVDGVWTVELARKLQTGYPDDTVFEASRTYAMAMGVHDDTGEMDKATDVIELSIAGATSLPPAAAQAESFDALKAGEPPPNWTLTMTGKGEPKWTVEKDETAPSKGNVLKQSGEATYPVALKNDTSIKDGFVEVKLKPIDGKEDQAGGVIWRAKDADNYYICRANALKDNVVLYKTENGKRKSIDIVGRKGGYGVEIKVAPQDWHTLRVEFAGNRFKVLFDGKHLFDAEDATFAEAGRAGVWTKADSVTLFDDFRCGP